MNATHTSEEWRPVVGFEGLYEVSDHGRVRSLDHFVDLSNGRRRRAPGRVLKPWDSEGYPKVGLTFEGRKRRALVHVLVLEAFVGARPEGAACCHNDGNRQNSRLSNLRWGTYSENNFDLVRHGTHYQASKTHCPQGHEYTTENTRIYTGRGYVERCCRTCQNARNRRAKREKRAAA